jgi:uncharacterized protein (TIGR02996 family)
MHNKGFLKAIIENPDDDTPRLVYSDWLDDHGQPERTEFIRLQCQLARLPEFDPRRADLRHREDELLWKNQYTWLKDVPKWAWPYTEDQTILNKEFHRGFLAVVTCSTAAWLAGSAGLLRRTPLERLFPQKTKPEQLDRLGESLRPARLKELGIHFAPANRVNLGKLATWTHLEGLPGLDLGWNRLGDADVAILARLPWLCRTSKLILRANNIGDPGLQILADSPFLTNLTELNLKFNRYTATGLVELIRSPNLQRLTALHLGVSGDRGTFRNELVQALAQTAGLPTLARLELTHRNDGAPLSREALVALMTSPHRSALTDLLLHGNQIGDGGAVALAELPQSKRLRWLDLSKNNIREVGATALAESSHLAGLQRLKLTGNTSCVVGKAKAALEKQFGARLTFMYEDD